MPHFGQAFLTDSTTTHGSFLVWFLIWAMVVMAGVGMSVVLFFSAMVCDPFWIFKRILQILGFNCPMGGHKYHWAAPLESNKLELVWIAGPLAVVFWMGYWNTIALYSEVAVGNVDFTVCATGHQWYWEYTLNFDEDHKFTYLSYAVPLEDMASSDVYLMSADYPLVIPGGPIWVQEGATTIRKIVRVRILVTSADVLHSFSVPSLSVKADACPGRINEIIVMPRVWGTHPGQCSELCGRLHSAMPINVEVISAKAYVWFLKKNMEQLS